MNCKKCGQERIEIFYHDRTKPLGKCVCRDCGEKWFIEKHNLISFIEKHNLQWKSNNSPATSSETPLAEVFGFQVPISDYYLHRGHAWAVLEDSGQVRVGMDDFSQKVLGAADDLKLPTIGKIYYQDHICMAMIKKKQKAFFMAPVDGTVAEINPKVVENPSLIHDDPYGEGWLLKVEPINLQRNLENLYSGEANAAWIDQEAHRLLNLMETDIGVTVPDGGTFIDDVYSNYPQLGWRRLVQTFLLTILSKDWKKRT